MRNALHFLVIWLAALAILVGAAWFSLSHTTQAWFDKDLALRSELAVSGARSALLQDLEQGRDANLTPLLEDIARDERILGAAVCSGPRVVAATRAWPRELSCAELGGHLVAVGRPIPSWNSSLPLPGGEVHVSAITLNRGVPTAGFAVVVHDLSFVARREASTRQFLLAAFAILALLASAVTLLSVRILWRGFGHALRQLASGQDDSRRREFQPLLKDLRDLLERLSREEQAELQGGLWSPERLKLTLQRHLHGERMIVMANREPYIHNRQPDGSIRVLHPASGLVSALEPVMRACSGVWVAHGAGSADRETADMRGRVRVPPGEESYSIRRVWLSPEEEQGYYYGFANEGLWPLCHVAHNRPIFRAEDWRHYQEVNRKFVDAVCDEVDGENPVILVQDYHFALAPRMLRERLPGATILTFWHIPWPNPEQISICPWHAELVDGLLGSSILGFHTQQHCNNFMDAVDRFLEARLDRGAFSVARHDRTTLVRPYPISVEWPNHWAQGAPTPEECQAAVRAELGLPLDAKLGMGVDRLDYTKGIEERLRAVERLFEREPEWIGRFSFLQLASPSRTLIDRYQRLNDDVEQLVNRINERFGTGDWKPVILRREHTEPADVFRYYRAADLCYVSSLHDGMNLVAKEYLAARSDERGVLILSKFAGAAHELTEALQVNPYDIEEASGALSTALHMPPQEQAARLRVMRSLVAEFNVYRWAGRMLIEASRLRSREQIAGILSSSQPGLKVPR
ncbi:trehalose-6-phosphate synthase [Solimonas sp. SE-A11]|uniref:trehalose-6-phosphate synthase n=1 Tax=Solimonas sp. SE-A11 TaxID=3054954 RepID=UPI00259CD821|nr:trehalose-6-phosphate synthase [Solimonas sp. SE-A11]MDM4773000.1 trehalose-6-phosphate synthase [Solimonas sp. SE-A11]